MNSKKIAKIAALVISGLFGLWLALTILVYTTGQQVEPFRSLWLFFDRYVDLNSLGLIGEYLLFFVPTAAAWTVYLSLRTRDRARARAAARTRARDADKLDKLFKELDGDKSETKPVSTPEAKPEEEKGELSEKEVKRIFSRYRASRMKMRTAVKVGMIVFAVLFLFWVVTDFSRAYLVAVTLVYAITLFVWLNQNQLPLMGSFYAIFAAFGIFYYLIPYRLTKKVLRVADNGKVKELGRVTLIKGIDEWGDPYRGGLYEAWMGLRFLGWLFHRKGRSWSKARPSPHELPFGDVYYLRGRKVSVRVTKNGGPEVDETKTERFHQCIILRSNTDGWIRRRIHPVPLYTNARLDIGWTVITAVEDGCKLYFFSRDAYGSSAHYELSAKPGIAVERDLAPYRTLVDATTKNAAAIVNQGIMADAEVQKDANREYNFPGPSDILDQYGFTLDDQGNPVLPKPEEKPGGKKDDKKEAGK